MKRNKNVKRKVREIHYFCCRMVDAASAEKFEGIVKRFVISYVQKLLKL